MKITILGSGGEKSTPVYGCSCKACRLANIDSTRRRKPASILLEYDGVKLLIDAGIKDFHDRFPPGSLKYVLLTKYQMDNMLGLYDVRSGIDVSIRIIGPKDPKACLSDNCAGLLNSPGILKFEQTAVPLESFQLDPFYITPLPLETSRSVVGYLIGCNGKCMVYLPDTAALSDSMVDNLREARVDMMFVDSNIPYPDGGSEKGDLEGALRIHNGTLTQKTILTHLGHDMDNWLINKGDTLPFDIEPANEGHILRL